MEKRLSEIHCLLSLQADLVYANFGEEEDFRLLKERSIVCRNKIVIMRVGRIFPGHMVSVIKLGLCNLNFFAVEINKC